MTIQDLYDAIPNREDVDAVFINAVFIRLMNLKKLSVQAENEPPMLTQRSREGDDRYVKNPFWEVYSREMSGIQQNLAELNLTPKSRKTLMNKMQGIPKLD